MQSLTTLRFQRIGIFNRIVTLLGQALPTLTLDLSIQRGQFIITNKEEIVKMAKQKNRAASPATEKKRQRKDADLAGLYAVPGTIAYDGKGNLRRGVYGVIRTDLPVVSKPGRDGKPSTFVRDFGDLPTACKNRVLAFREDAANAKKTKCFLAEKALYDEARGKQPAAAPQPGKGNARTAKTAPAKTAPAKSGTVPPWVKKNNGGKKK